MAKTGEISKDKFQEWLDETADVNKLPERIGKKKTGSSKTGNSPRKKEKVKSIKSKSTKSKRVYMSGNRNKVKR